MAQPIAYNSHSGMFAGFLDRFLIGIPPETGGLTSRSNSWKSYIYMNYNHLAAIRTIGLDGSFRRCRTLSH